MVADNVIRAKKALGEAGFPHTEGRLEEFELANTPGALAQLGSWPRKESTSIVPMPRCTRGQKSRS